MTHSRPPDNAPLRVLYFAGTHGDWGGASRALFSTLSLLDRSRFEPIVALTMEGPARAILARMGIECVIWGSMTEYRSPIQYAAAVVRALSWLRRRRIDLVHMNRANDWRPAEHVAARLLRMPIVTHFHTVNLDKAPATRLSSAIAAVSDYVARNSALLGVPVHVIQNSIDPARFAGGKDIRDELGVDRTDVLVTFAGQIRRIKGVDLFVAAAKRVAGENLKVLVVGACRRGAGIDDAYMEDEFRELIASDRRIVYAGYREDMPDVYHSSDVVVMPSRWAEPFGLVLIEAGMAMKPVVATAVGGVPEVVRDGETGYLVPPEDIAVLADRIQALVNDPELRRKMGSAARARVLSEFTTRPVRELERLYQSLR
jgi:glycosyltransferase involved in cell wall biosynthesis